MHLQSLAKENWRTLVRKDRSVHFSQATMHALRAWVGSPTWYTSHPDDEARFSDFVFALWRDEGKWSEAEVQETVRNELASLAGNDRLAGQEWVWRTVREKVILARIMTNFLEHARAKIAQ